MKGRWVSARHRPAQLGAVSRLVVARLWAGDVALPEVRAGAQALAGEPAVELAPAVAEALVAAVVGGLHHPRRGQRTGADAARGLDRSRDRHADVEVEGRRVGHRIV